MAMLFRGWSIFAPKELRLSEAAVPGSEAVRQRSKPATSSSRRRSLQHKVAGRFVDFDFLSTVVTAVAFFLPYLVGNTLLYHIHVWELRVHTLSEVADRPTKELMIILRIGRRDMASLFDSGNGSSTSDLVRVVWLPTTRSSAVLRCRLRIWGRLEACEFAANKKQQYIGSTSHQSSRMAWPCI